MVESFWFAMVNVDGGYERWREEKAEKSEDTEAAAASAKTLVYGNFGFGTTSGPPHRLSQCPAPALPAEAKLYQAMTRQLW